MQFSLKYAAFRVSRKATSFVLQIYQLVIGDPVNAMNCETNFGHKILVIIHVYIPFRI